jgi:hypothetical protein
MTKPEPRDTLVHDWVKYRMVDIAEYCRDKYPCQYEWAAPEWAKTVMSWYYDKMITQLEFDRFLIWINENDITSEYPPYVPTR